VDAGTSLDLSKATKLRVLEFRCRIPNVGWIAAALGTIKSGTLQQITICPYPATFRDLIVATDHQECQDLDRTLIQFWISHSIRPRFAYALEDGEKDVMDRVSRLLPDLTRRGLVDVVEQPSPVIRGIMRR